MATLRNLTSEEIKKYYGNGYVIGNAKLIPSSKILAAMRSKKENEKQKSQQIDEQSTNEK